MVTNTPDSETLRRAALEASWRRGQGVAQRRLWWRWTVWAALRVLPLLALAAIAFWGWTAWHRRYDTEAIVASFVAERVQQQAPPRTIDALGTPVASQPFESLAVSGPSLLPAPPVAAPVVARKSADPASTASALPVVAAASAPSGVNTAVVARAPGAVQLRLDFVTAQPAPAPAAAPATARPPPAGDKPR